MPGVWPSKDPEDILDFGYDWSPLIEDSTDTITTTTASVVSGAGLVVSQHEKVPDPDQATVTWLSGGTAGETAAVRLRINTTKGRRFDQTMSIKIEER